MASESRYNELTSQFEPIQLDEINQLKLLKRVDKKFVMPVYRLPELLNAVKNDYRILEIEGSRDFEYFTRYYDTPDLDYYYKHQNGRANRYKIRTRDYIISNNTFLEVKRKTNKGRTLKSRMPIDPCAQLESEHYEYLNTVVPDDERNLVGTLEIRFRRITIVSFKTLERITIDYNLSFSQNKNTKSFPGISIVEVKRDKMGSASPVTLTLKKFKVYARGFSKYCVGLSYLKPEIKQNSFKKTKLYLKKLEYANNTR